MQKFYITITAVSFFLLGFVSTAYAANTIGLPEDPLFMLAPIIDAFRGGQYWYAGSLALVGIVAALRLWGAKYTTWFASDQGGAALALLGSFALTLATNLASGITPTLEIVKTALLIAFAASGGYSVIKRLLITPYLIPFVEKNPKWRPVLVIVLWVFDGKR